MTLTKRHRRALNAYNRGTIALNTDDVYTSERALIESLSHSPFNENAWINLGNAMMAEGDVHGALGMYRRAMWCNADDPRGAVNTAIALLTLGQWAEGWKLYEARFALPGFVERNGLKGGDASKMWRGESLEGTTLLVFNEQGVGDSLMMLRYVPELIERSARVVLRVPTSLLRLCRASFGSTVDVVSDTERLPEHDYLVPFMSLPHRCHALPAQPYLRTSSGDEQFARARWPQIGIVWKGNPHHTGDKRRSMTREQFDAFDVPGVDIVSLQYGEGFTPADFYDTAVRLKSIDLLITVDTSLAHLAGALGVPTWLLLPFAADFRWGRAGETTAWYAAMRLFRQTKAGDWSSVIENVRSELFTLTNHRSTA